MKKSIVDFVLKEPEIDEDERFLDEDDEAPMTIELAGVSNAWRRMYRQSRWDHMSIFYDVDSQYFGLN